MRWSVWVMGLVFAAAGDGPTWAKSATELARQGNELYRDERYQDAVDRYREALTLDPTSSVIQYNLGTGLAQQGRYDEAEQLLTQAAHLPESLKRADAFYNLGVTKLLRTNLIEPAVPTPPGAPAANSPSLAGNPGQNEEQLRHLRDALAAFRQAILIDPQDKDAKTNYELTRMILDRLEQQSQQQPQDKNRQDQPEQGESDRPQTRPQDKPGGNPDKDTQGEQEAPQPGDQPEKGSQSSNGPQEQPQPGDPSADGDPAATPTPAGQNPAQSAASPSTQEQGLESRPTPAPTAQSAAPPAERPTDPPAGDAAGEATFQQPPLTPDQMDALRVLNLLEAEKPEQFKQLFRFQGRADFRPPEKDW